MVRPNPEVGVEETVSFTRQHVSAGARILDVGCGAGEVSAALVAAGHELVAIDPDAEAVAASLARGLDAKESRLQHFSGDAFDAVLLSRSLHHIRDVSQALECVAKLLKPGGVLLLEEFGIERVDRPTAVWYYGLIDLLAGCAVMDPDDGGPSDALERWRHEHHHEGDLHTSNVMREKVRSRFSVEVEHDGPYLFRHLASELVAKAGVEACRKVLEWERQLIDSAAIQAIGWRVVARLG